MSPSKRGPLTRVGEDLFMREDLYVTRSGLAPPAVWKPSDYSEQQEKEVLQRALGQVRFSCTVFNYVCNRCVTITSRSQLFVTALELFARPKKGCGALWYL